MPQPPLPLHPSEGLFAYVMSPNICAALGEVRHAINWAKRPPVHPLEVGQMVNLVPSLVNCLWQQWHTQTHTHTQLSEGNTNWSSTDWSGCSCINSCRWNACYHNHRASHFNSLCVIVCFIYRVVLIIAVFFFGNELLFCSTCKARLQPTYTQRLSDVNIRPSITCLRRWPGVVF